jgi:hypothetical protein
LFQNHGRWEKSRLAAVKVLHGARQYSNQFPVPDHAESRGWQFLSQARFLILSGAGAALFWANYQNCNALLHTYQITGEVKARPNLSGPQHLMDFLDLGSLGLRLLHQLIKNKENRGNFFNKRAELKMMIKGTVS